MQIMGYSSDRYLVVEEVRALACESLGHVESGVTTGASRAHLLGPNLGHYAATKRRWEVRGVTARRAGPG